MLSQRAEYALRAVVCLGAHGGAPLGAQAIAARAGIPPAYLAKILRGLADAGLLSARRGRVGGYALARPARAIAALEVVEAVEPIPRIERCPLGRPEHGAGLCPLHRHLDDLAAQLQRGLAAWSIADLVDAGSLQPVACPFPLPADAAAGAAGTPANAPSASRRLTRAPRGHESGGTE